MRYFQYLIAALCISGFFVIVYETQKVDIPDVAKVPEKIKSSAEKRSDFLQVLKNANVGILYSLEPSNSESGFHNFKVLGSITVTSTEAKVVITEFLRAIESYNNGPVAGCFNPRHGLRLEVNGLNYDFLLCYQCAQMLAIDSKGNEAWFELGREKNSILDELLKKRKIPLSEK